MPSAKPSIYRGDTGTTFLILSVIRTVLVAGACHQALGQVRLNPAPEVYRIAR